MDARNKMGIHIMEFEQDGRRLGREKGLKEGRKAGLKEGIIDGLLEGYRRGHEEGLELGRLEMLRKCVLETLESRFFVPILDDIEYDLNKLNDLDTLRSIHHDAYYAESTQAFSRLVADAVSEQERWNDMQELVEEPD